MFSPEVDIHNIWLVSDKMIAVTYVQKEEFVEVMANTNPVIAAYTTAYARLKLYSYIEKLNDRVMYFDTDSVVYTTDLSKRRQYEVSVGNSLGDMTDEMREFGDGAVLEEFVSGGPKNYAYKVIVPGQQQPVFVTKVRGITLSNTTSRRINFQSLRRMVKKYVERGETDQINIISNRIDRKQKTNRVVTRPAVKKFRIVYDKRIIRRDFTTVPYGW